MARAIPCAFLGVPLDVAGFVGTDRGKRLHAAMLFPEGDAVNDAPFPFV